MRLNEYEWVWLSLIESDWVWISLNESQIRYKRLIKSSSINLLHDRSRKYWREHSQKSHTNEKSHASERLWSESHFRLVYVRFLSLKLSEWGITPSFFWYHFITCVLYGHCIVNMYYYVFLENRLKSYFCMWLHKNMRKMEKILSKILRQIKT